MLRTLETEGTHNIKITGYGTAKGVTEGGAKLYEFEANPEEQVDFVLTAKEHGPKAMAGNFFGAGAKRTGFASECGLRHLYRLQFDPVGGILKPMKPLAATSKTVALTKGKPVMVGWY